ncbi:glycosylhydrolase-like jelly roll fold domain-containing protein [Streptococcus gallolyticus]|uniref:glycosylhydrolase-like jelly roll fold domain-containing protein n=1 Tax=Streptococcus gallolyticus TaxID=315405 RepID=UPI0009430E5D|nr:glycosylhydrolase-like jelly roll fold domain-containing protein [Streptococcus gallolyticus]
MAKLKPINTLPSYDRITGTVAYTATVNLDNAEQICKIDLGAAYEVAQVFINGKSAGARIAPPYIFDVTDLFHEGENTIRIEVTNTLGTQFRGGLNQYLLVEPFGLTETVKISRRK